MGKGYDRVDFYNYNAQQKKLKKPYKNEKICKRVKMIL